MEVIRTDSMASFRTTATRSLTYVGPLDGGQLATALAATPTRLLALTAAIWHNHKTGQPVLRSLIAYDHS
jgi:hypothetical protein